jgi:hypothetical protein
MNTFVAAIQIAAPHLLTSVPNELSRVCTEETPCTLRCCWV